MADTRGPCPSTENNIVGTSEGIRLGVSKSIPCASEIVQRLLVETSETVGAGGLENEEIYSVANIVNV